jgi:hypothetical protein
MDVKTIWDSMPELLEHAYRFREFTQEWLYIPMYTDYQPLSTTEHEWTIVKYIRVTRDLPQRLP